MFAPPISQDDRRDVPAEKYSLVFEGTITASNLGEIFRIFNVARPIGYTGRSLTHTDVVEVDDGQEHDFYIYENIGFTKANFAAESCMKGNNKMKNDRLGFSMEYM